jgi:protein tyrosine/serine phosphatase
MVLMRQAFLRCVLATAIAVSPAIPAMAGESRVTRASITIGNFGEVSPTYFRGEQPEGSEYATLAAFGIKTVIDLQADGQSNERGLVERAGMKFHRIPMTTHVAPTKAQIAEFLKLVNDPANQPVYVHCAGGKHRTGVMTAVYRMANDGWTSDRAFKEMKSYKFGADFLHSEFKRFVYAFRPEQPSTAPTIPGGVIATTTPAIE